MTAGSNGLVSASPWRRLMGIAYESVILFGVLWLANYLFSSLTTYKAEDGTMRLIFQLFQVLVLGAYFVGFWSGGRRTLPMKTLELQLIDSQGAFLSPARALLRYAVAMVLLLGALALYKVHPLVFLLALLVPAGWSVIDPQRRALYDILAGTALVIDRIPEPGPKPV